MAPGSNEVAAEKKAYDLKELGSHLKSQGLELAEDAAEKVAKATLAWLKESAAISKNPYDDMALVVLPQVEKVIYSQIDKIDGKVG